MPARGYPGFGLWSQIKSGRRERPSPQICDPLPHISCHTSSRQQPQPWLPILLRVLALTVSQALKRSSITLGQGEHHMIRPWTRCRRSLLLPVSSTPVCDLELGDTSGYVMGWRRLTSLVDLIMRSVPLDLPGHRVLFRRLRIRWNCHVWHQRNEAVSIVLRAQGRWREDWHYLR